MAARGGDSESGAAVTGIMAALDRGFQVLIRAREWTPHEMVVLLVLACVLLSVAASYLADGLFAGVAAVRRWRCRREVRRGEGGLSRYADPARIHRETAHHVDRLAARPAAADAGADRRLGAAGVVGPDSGVEGVTDTRRHVVEVAGVRGDATRGRVEGPGHLGAGVPAVSRAAQRVVRDGRTGGYGAGTTLVNPLAADAKKRVNGNGR